MLVANEGTMITQFAYSFCKSLIIRHTNTRFTIRSQVFTEVETETANISDTANSLSLVGRTVGLRSILNYT